MVVCVATATAAAPDDDDIPMMEGEWRHAVKTSGENLKNVMHCRFSSNVFLYLAMAISKLIILHDKVFGASAVANTVGTQLTKNRFNNVPLIQSKRNIYV